MEKNTKASERPLERIVRCKHIDARIISHSEGGLVNAVCQCGQGWIGPGCEWISARGRLHKPPEWVKRLLVPNARLERLAGNEDEETPT